MTPKHHLQNRNCLALIALATALLLPCGGALRAAVILASYNFTGSATSSVNPDNSVLTAVSAGNPGSDPGVTITSTNNNVAWTQGVVSGVGTDTSAALSLSGNWYMEFTLTPNTGYVLNLTSLVFNIGGTLGDTSQSFTASFFVRSNLVDNFNTNVGSLQTWFVDQNSDNPSSNPLVNNTPPVTIDLSSTAFQNVETAVTFRIYAYVNGANVTTKNTRPRLDNLVLNGEVAAVPEPGTVALAALGLAGFTIFGRKVRKNSH